MAWIRKYEAKLVVVGFFLKILRRDLSRNLNDRIAYICGQQPETARYLGCFFRFIPLSQLKCIKRAESILAPENRFNIRLFYA